jgi:hypothetical protein
VDEPDLTVILEVPPPAQVGLQTANDHVDRPLGLLERVVGFACLRRERKVALVAAVLRLLIITSPIILEIVVSTSTSVVAAVVVVAT